MDLITLEHPGRNGPGLWRLLHLTAARVTTPDAEQFFEQFLNLWITGLTCPECLSHFRNFTRQRPLSSYRSSFNGIPGYFRWTWELHNDVNRKLHKPVVDLSTSYQAYAVNVNFNNPGFNPPMTYQSA